MIEAQIIAKAVGCPLDEAAAVRDRMFTLIIQRALARMTTRDRNKALRESWKDIQFERQLKIATNHIKQ